MLFVAVADRTGNRDGAGDTAVEIRHAVEVEDVGKQRQGSRCPCRKEFFVHLVFFKEVTATG